VWLFAQNFEQILEEIMPDWIWRRNLLQYVIKLVSPLVGQSLLIIETSRSHSDTPHSAGLPWRSHQPDAETSNLPAITIHAPGGFELTIPASGRPQAHVLDRATTGVSDNTCTVFYTSDSVTTGPLLRFLTRINE
jgi:hypothetical protein